MGGGGSLLLNLLIQIRVAKNLHALSFDINSEFGSILVEERALWGELYQHTGHH